MHNEPVAVAEVDRAEVGMVEPCCGAPTGSRASERRRRVAEAARMLFAEHGFHGAGMAQIATQSGVKVGQIYRDFASKEHIVAAIVEGDLNAYLDESLLHAAINRGDAPAIRGWIRDLVERKAHPQESPLLPEILAESGRNDRISAILRCIDARVRACVLAALGALSSLPLDTPRLGASADLVMTVMMGLCSRQIAGLDADSAGLAARVQQMIERELNALAAEPAA